LTRESAKKRKIRLGNLSPPSGSTRKGKKVGRGPGSGHGKTSTRGHKGQLSRAGAKRRSWFEGGQMPLQRRVPKRGFTNIFRKEFQVVNLSALSEAISRAAETAKDPISIEVLNRMGLVKGKNLPVKILGNGEIRGAITVRANAFSKKAKEKIEAAGGKVEVVRC
jgi:large subunit ribosomal protein L15